MELFFLLALGVVLLIGTYTDIKTREVPDWVNYSLITVGLGSRAIFSLTHGDYSFILSGLVGFGVFFALAWVMFYTGQWGGGDSKMLMGVGAVLGIGWNLEHTAIAFVVNTIIVSAVYGLAWTVGMAAKHHKAFRKEFALLSNQSAMLKTRKLVLGIMLGAIVSMFLLDKQYLFLLGFLAAFLFILFYFWIATKAVENSCMLKNVDPKDLTEGEWIAKDIVVEGKRIASPKDLGIEKKQIEKLIALKKKGKIKTVQIKQGIPFVPSFLLGFVVTLAWGNVAILLL